MKRLTPLFITGALAMSLLACAGCGKPAASPDGNVGVPPNQVPPPPAGVTTPMNSGSGAPVSPGAPGAPAPQTTPPAGTK